jgi:hypothetical protein
MKRLALILPLMMLVLSVTALAQMRMDPAERTKELKEQLKLTDDQAAKVQKIYEEAQSEAMAQMGESGGSRGERRGAMQSIMTKAHEKVILLLNDEQKEAYQKIIDERRSQRQRRN